MAVQGKKSAGDPDVLGEPYYAETLDLALHGFADYFFQTLAADFWVDRGYDFYALDLRKCGRSIRPHQTPNFVTDLASYFEEIDEAMRLVRDRDGHPHVVLTAHSTGGLGRQGCGHDIVLDVDQIREWAHQLGDHVTLVRIPGALHDITLSAHPVRTVAFDVTSRWLAAHIER